MWKLQCDSESHSITFSIHISLLASGHCKESLVWFQASSFCYTSDTRPAWDSPQDKDNLCLGDPIALNLQNQPLHVLHRS